MNYDYDNTLSIIMVSQSLSCISYDLNLPEQRASPFPEAIFVQKQKKKEKSISIKIMV